jgi:hypothetical protein
MLGHTPNAEETDRALDALSQSWRRRLLFELYEEVNSGAGTPLNYTDTTPRWTEKERILLQHVHLPKLEEYGYVTWNEAEKTIQIGPRWDEIEPLLDLIHSHLCELPSFLQGKPSNSTGKKC